MMAVGTPMLVTGEWAPRLGQHTTVHWQYIALITAQTMPSGCNAIGLALFRPLPHRALSPMLRHMRLACDGVRGCDNPLQWQCCPGAQLVEVCGAACVQRTHSVHTRALADTCLTFPSCCRR